MNLVNNLNIGRNINIPYSLHLAPWYRRWQNLPKEVLNVLKNIYFVLEKTTIARKHWTSIICYDEIYD